ncbi:hypothetical protein EXU57_10570 [Segetibacter sp. 3557_3]|uniref:hypothetical protein n=1 Tax=Segetibacter sp. 3557_3 TaxID=2547429 RepID=UPI001058B19A|nr:hypothetical protein [Segetibacter sp. 3557_3]TDH26526.1 hypothetical protein EXU57_10570 [Segetibacter sp. 3557_3]
MKKIILVTLCSLVVVVSFSQDRTISSRQQKKNDRKEKVNQLIKQEEEGALIFHKQSVFGLKLTSDGYGAFYELGRLKTPTKTNLYSLEIGERKHDKEEKLSRGDAFGLLVGNPFIYGKINNFYYAKLGIGQQRLIGGKGNKNGVAVTALYGGGFSAGLLKPYFLDISDSRTGKRSDVKYNDNDSVFLNPSVINGASGLGKGFNELKFVPGLYAKVGMRFDYGRYNEMVSAVEVGVHAEYYSQKMPILLLQKQRQLFLNAYAAIVFGRRR